MAEEGAIQPQSNPEASIAPGGAASNFDMLSERDRGTIRTAIRRWPKRWRGVDDQFKDDIVKGLKEAQADTTAIPDPEGRINARVSIARTVLLMEGQSQADEHLEHKTTDDGAEKHEHRFTTFIKGVDEDAV